MSEPLLLELAMTWLPVGVQGITGQSQQLQTGKQHEAWYGGAHGSLAREHGVLFQR